MKEKRKNARAEKLIQALGQIAHDNLTKETKISRRPTKIDVRVIVDQSAEFGISESWVRGVVNPIIESSGYKLSNEFGEDAPWVFTVYIQSMPITKGVNSAYHIDVSLDAFCLLAKKVKDSKSSQSSKASTSETKDASSCKFVVIGILSKLERLFWKFFLDIPN